MKSFIRSLLSLFVVLVLFACSDNVQAPIEGTHYSVITNPMEDERAVVEIFSLACDHCRAMEDVIPTLEQETKLDFDKEHVTFNETAQRSAYLYYAAHIQSPGGLDQELVKALFGFVQDVSEDKTVEDRRKQLVKLFAKYGLVSPIDLDDSQNEKVYQKMIAAEAFVANTGLSSVPVFLVKGKYLVDSSNHDTTDELAATINYLSKL